MNWKSKKGITADVASGNEVIAVKEGKSSPSEEESYDEGNRSVGTAKNRKQNSHSYYIQSEESAT
jgi:hypothetical protein